MECCDGNVKMVVDAEDAVEMKMLMMMIKN